MSFVAKACMTEALSCALMDCKIPSLSSRCWTASTTSVDAVMTRSNSNPIHSEKKMSFSAVESLNFAILFEISALIIPQRVENLNCLN